MMTFLITSITYFVFFESSTWQGTLGKSFLKLKIININGDRLSFYQCCLRTLFKLFTISTVFGFLLIFFTAKKQLLHDILIKSTVINKK